MSRPAWRTWASLGALGVAATVVPVVGLDLSWTMRPYLVTVLFLLVPGVALWGRSDVVDPALWATVVLATSVAVSSALGLALVWANAWAPDRGAIGLAIAALPLLLAGHRPGSEALDG